MRRQSRKPDWRCPNCNDLVFGSKNECRCGERRQQALVVQKPGDWRCNCGELCFATRSTCRKCNAVKPDVPVVVPDAAILAAAHKPGDWNCECGEMCFGSRTVCRKCGKARQSAVEAAPRQLPTDSKCAVCFDREINTVLLKCRHVGLCIECALSMNKCPFCRMPYEDKDIITTFRAV